MNRIDEIRRDRRHGARWLTRRAAEALLEIARERPHQLPEACRALASAQPAMAPVVQLATDAACSADVEALCLRTVDQLERSGRAVVNRAAALVADGGVVLTHSHSSTVESALVAAHARGTRFRVLATESQPLGEGVALAAALRNAGMDVTLIPDGEVPPAATLVMVGADAVTPAAVVNKVGTAAIARVAHERGIPFYVVSTSDKLVASHELIDPEGLYDVTPRELVTAIVTE
jgi:translation initiation factor 2B subunit (eIF-2B alpha/beta/delta family)